MEPEPAQVGSARERDQVYRALADERRRGVLAILENADAPLAVADLALEIARREHDDGVSDESYETAEQLRISLYHCHLPKLADAGLVDYDTDRQLVTLSDEPTADDLASRLVTAEL